MHNNDEKRSLKAGKDEQGALLSPNDAPGGSGCIIYETRLPEEAVAPIRSLTNSGRNNPSKFMTYQIADNLSMNGKQ